MVKTVQKSSSPKLAGRCSLNLVYIISDKICSNDNPVFTLTYFTARSTLLPNVFVWENDFKIQGFIETIEVYELKVGTSS